MKKSVMSRPHGSLRANGLNQGYNLISPPSMYIVHVSCSSSIYGIKSAIGFVGVLCSFPCHCSLFSISCFFLPDLIFLRSIVSRFSSDILFSFAALSVRSLHHAIHTISRVVSMNSICDYRSPLLQLIRLGCIFMTNELKLKCGQYPAIHTNYIMSQSTTL